MSAAPRKQRINRLKKRRSAGFVSLERGGMASDSSTVLLLSGSKDIVGSHSLKTATGFAKYTSFKAYSKLDY